MGVSRTSFTTPTTSNARGFGGSLNGPGGVIRLNPSVPTLRDVVTILRPSAGRPARYRVANDSLTTTTGAASAVSKRDNDRPDAIVARIDSKYPSVTM